MQINLDKNNVIHIYDLFQEGGAHITVCDKGFIILYEIPLYGGEESYVQHCSSIQEAIAIGKTWT